MKRKEERNSHILALFEGGMSCAKIGRQEDIKLTRQRVWQIIRAAEKKLSTPES